MRHHVEHRMKKTVPNGRILSTWLVTWAADVINNYRLQSNGRTAYDLTTQHKCKHVVVGFGEKSTSSILRLRRVNLRRT